MKKIILSLALAAFAAVAPAQTLSDLMKDMGNLLEDLKVEEHLEKFTKEADRLSKKYEGKEWRDFFSPEVAEDLENFSKKLEGLDLSDKDVEKMGKKMEKMEKKYNRALDEFFSDAQKSELMSTLQRLEKTLGNLFGGLIGN